MRNFNQFLSTKIKSYMESNNMSQLDFLLILKAHNCDVSVSTLNSWVRGISIPTKKDHQEVLFNILGINHLDLSSNFIPAEKKAFPLLGTVACGEPIFADEKRECYVMADTNISADFCLICKGDSMSPLVKNGDVVFVKKQEFVRNGEVAVVIIDDEATLKRFYQDKDKITLVAENRNYAPIVILASENKSIRICGKAVFYQSLII